MRELFFYLVEVKLGKVPVLEVRLKVIGRCGSKKNGLAGMHKGGTSEYKIAGRGGSVVVEAELDAGNLSEPRRHMRPHVRHPLGDQRDTSPCSTLNGCNPATCQISDYRGLVRRKPY